MLKMKEKKRNLFFFLWFKKTILETENFFNQSCVNRTETVGGRTLRFLFLSHVLYGICVKMFILNRYILKSNTYY